MKKQGSQRICKKCLLREMAAEDQKEIQKYIDAVKKQDRVQEHIYEERLAVCKECEKLQEATCQACGCYVEIRAVLKHGKCPYKKWKC